MNNAFDDLYNSILEAAYAVSAKDKKLIAQRDKAGIYRIKAYLKGLDIEALFRSFVITDETPEVQAVLTGKTDVARRAALYNLPAIRELVDNIALEGKQNSILTKILKFIKIRAPYRDKPRSKLTNPQLKIIEAIIGSKPWNIKQPGLAATNFMKTYKADARQQSFASSGYIEDFYQFLPEKVSMELSPTREVTAFVENYGNKEFTIDQKIKRTAWIVDNRDEILDTVVGDILQNQDEIKKLSALETGVTIATGIRPSDTDRKAPQKIDGKVQFDDDGKKIMVDTFGTTTLKPEHFVRVSPDEIVLEFVGKMASHNKAIIRNDNKFNNLIITELTKLYNNAVENGYKYVFTTSKGKHVDYSTFFPYFKGNWGDLKPTDFRKEISANTFYSALKRYSEKMFIDYNEMVDSGKEDLEDEMVKSIIDVVEKALEDARAALSHDTVTTTIDQYLDPRIIINFLNAGNMNATYKDILVNNKDVRVSFDINTFINYAKSSRPTVEAIEQNNIFTVEDLPTREEKKSPIDIMRRGQNFLKRAKSLVSRGIQSFKQYFGF